MTHLCSYIFNKIIIIVEYKLNVYGSLIIIMVKFSQGFRFEL